jgi:HK97 family phage prohead protease
VKHEHGSYGFKIKGLDSAGEGSFEGLLAVYNVVDYGNDLIEPGAFTRTLNAKRTVPLLWQHDPAAPIGTLEITDSDQGLRVKGQLLLDLPQAKIAHSLLLAKVISGLSIGYETIKDSVEDGVRRLKELRLWEGSVVTFPMNEMAVVSSVKSMSDDDRAKHMKAIDGHRRTIDRAQRQIRQHLKSMFDGLDEDDCDDRDEDDDGDGEEMKQFVSEMQKLVEEAEELA